MRQLYSDAHFHFCDWQREAKAAQGVAPSLEEGLYCACALSIEEFAACEALKESFLGSSGGIFISIGAHPQLPAVLAKEGKSPAQARIELSRLLEAISFFAKSRRVDAIGEAGFDFYSREFAATKEAQKALFEAQLEIAQRLNLPLVIHARKAQEEIFACSFKLKRLPAVVFHGYGGAAGEAASLLRRGVNAYFSFGKALLRGSRKAAESIASMPKERLLLETDAPFMTLKDETFSSPSDIKAVCEKASRILGIPLEELKSIAAKNFLLAYGAGREG